MTDRPFETEDEKKSSVNDRFEVEEEKPEFKRPDFVVIDERNGKKMYTHFGEKTSQNEDKETPAKGNVSLRFLCLLGLIFCLVFGLGILVWSIVLTFLATLSFFQNPTLNQGVKSFWKLYSHIVIVGLGFILGLISPTLGLGLIGLYFSITGEVIDNSLLRKILKGSFNRF
jgi:hypothetical protein